MSTSQTMQRFYVAGEPIELWEDPALPFRCTPDEIRTYAMRGSWVLVFNALALAGAPVQSE